MPVSLPLLPGWLYFRPPAAACPARGAALSRDAGRPPLQPHASAPYQEALARHAYHRHAHPAPSFA
ncbi:hypothetical protein KBK19_17710 [Microvirga sp. STR05]|uniref:Uncharacterized protein n=1 Tax=Hymenobacter duratus TaxID=2771356 RepID=A0ABR8JLX1_9BACT|nr:hypothetical protein [Hymenobacter duratus]MBD2716885.1 hypothetical protein [Hymenobacter duratus]MBR7951801.1 hypothetical protein [Microvirga sp. STR05]